MLGRVSGASVEDRLSNLRAVTDTTLNRLDVEDMLVEILDRLRGILDADTAAVLLREPDTDYLVARAACGLEEEVRQAVHIRIGSGFAGTVAATRKPVSLDRIDQTSVSNSILWEKGVQAMLGVPLFAGDEVIGVLHVGRLRPDRFTDFDTNLLELAAERVTAALQARRLAVEAAAARMLERGLLPSRLPWLPDVRFASRYAPAHNRTIGGDWYDIFTLPSGELWLVVGDVAGHGLDAAVVMGRVKSALRAYALVGDGPARVLELTDRKVQHFEIGMMVTVICAVTRAPYTHFEIASAGHPPALLAPPDETARLLRVKPGPPLGVVSEVKRRSESFTAPPGSVLLFYTDGLIERRDRNLDEGLERLRGFVRAQDPEAVCRDVMHGLVGDEDTPDDIALLAMQTSGTSTSARGDHAEILGEVDLLPDVSAVAEARRFVLAAAERTGDIDIPRNTLRLLVSELATNCVVHARTPFTIRVLCSGEDLLVELTDAAEGQVQLGLPWPTDLSGRGVFLVEQLAKEWGVRPLSGRPGKTVWFAVPAAAEPEATYREQA
jgi:anti-sigma regulatory factor (Ser/Thr protein kinase)